MCANCVYFLILEPSSGKGRCRYDAPRIVSGGESPTKDDLGGRRWPICWRDEWCGKWADKT